MNIGHEMERDLHKPDEKPLSEEAKRLLTLEAMFEADAGNVVEHAAVAAWAASLGTDTPLPTPGS
jgi:predicted transcriptional regulator